ncbi:MAG: CvpA family protein [Betaproteobacteria bacterium]|nr:CvpA family protein [Betaproteobacteria bacterium]
MTVFDYAVLVIVGLSILLSVIRGLVREVLALLAWVAAFAVAILFGAKVAAVMPAAIPSEELRLLAGFVTVFLGVLLGMSLAAIAISRLVKSAGLGVEDRMFGMLFGFARGALIVLVLVLLAGLTTLPRDPLWRNAMLSSPLEAFATYVKVWLPGDLSQRIKYD